MPSHPCPHHCPPERGSGLGIVVAIAALVAAGAAVRAAARPLEHAAKLGLDIAFITLGIFVALAAVAAAAYMAHRAHRRHASDRRPIPTGTRRAALNCAQVAAAPRAIQAPRPVPIDALVIRNQARGRKSAPNDRFPAFPNPEL
jgi:hypothetical protein